MIYFDKKTQGYRREYYKIQKLADEYYEDYHIIFSLYISGL